eukprot:CAMPEP_0195064924 /NCGR_PEP_ID=MMETSP0448-20130528/10745_1 /TAXON_ID=66468 /ORGANISM="Heterocapsa triquestra, Strain CCMP 448" /LENGTH=65 /DNA_ID=CAMNT_0040095969 /DNA_START=28 /DNA_END=226 /DNA_ORIENTATION=-
MAVQKLTGAPDGHWEGQSENALGQEHISAPQSCMATSGLGPPPGPKNLWKIAQRPHGCAGTSMME